MSTILEHNREFRIELEPMGPQKRDDTDILAKLEMITSVSEPRPLASPNTPHQIYEKGYSEVPAPYDTRTVDCVIIEDIVKGKAHYKC
jgi:hypothetical protein